MLYPSIDSLLDKMHSKYLLVSVAAKRAREMQDSQSYAMKSYKSYKTVGKALEEIDAGVLISENKREDFQESLYEKVPSISQEADA